MKNSKEKISITKLEAAINSDDRFPETTTVEWNGLNIIIKRTISIQEMFTAADLISHACFAAEDDSYQPENKDFAIRNYVMELYTNVTLPADTEKRYYMLYKSDLFNVVLEHINKQQFNTMLRAVDEKVDYAVRAQLDGMQRQAGDLIREIRHVSDQISSIFKDISGDDVNKLVETLVSGIDENKLAEAYIEQKYKGPDTETEHLTPEEPEGADEA